MKHLKKTQTKTFQHNIVKLWFNSSIPDQAMLK